MRALLAAAAAMAVVLAAGCGGGAPPRADPRTSASAFASSSAPAFVTLTRLQACQWLATDIARNGGVPDVQALRYVADHAATPRLAADARTAVRDIGHTGAAPVALRLIEDECTRAGVYFQVP